MLSALVVTLATMIAVAANASAASTAVMITVSVVIPSSLRHRSASWSRSCHQASWMRTWVCSICMFSFQCCCGSQCEDVGERGPTDEHQEGDEQQHDRAGHLLGGPFCRCFDG